MGENLIGLIWADMQCYLDGPKKSLDFVHWVEQSNQQQINSTSVTLSCIS